MIVVFSHAHPSISKGGAEVSAYTLFKGLRELGRPAKFVAMCPQAQLAGVRFGTDDEIVIPYNPEHYDQFFHIGAPGLGQELIDALSPFSPQALVFHHFLFLGTNTIKILAKHFAIPSAIVLHEFLAICHHHGQMVTRPHKNLCSQATPTRCAECFPESSSEELNARRANFADLLTSVSALVSPSHFLADRFEQWGIAKERIHVIENGLASYAKSIESVVAPGVKPSSAKNRKLLTSASQTRQIVFGYFGQINPFKGVDQILDAAEILQAITASPSGCCVRVHGNIVGVTDEFRTRFELACQSNGIVEYMGAYNNADVHSLMASCDYILMASKWWENSPVVIQEAYASEKPVIVPGFGGMAEKVIDGVSGWHFKPNDPTDLARVIAACIKKHVNQVTRYRIPPPLSAKGMAERYLDVLLGGRSSAHDRIAIQPIKQGNP